MKAEKFGDITLYNADCMEIMKTFNDKQFDLCIVDPPYGLGSRLAHAGNGRNAQSKFSNQFHLKGWDNEPPPIEYFDELFRVSTNQIIFGGNYFPLPPTRCFVVWDKMVFITSMSRVELAWTSFDKLPKYIQINNTDPNRIHLTQKPVKLYKWLLQNYAKEGDTILDTHFGSLSIGIACHDLGFDLTAIELDKDYYEAGKERLRNHQRQLTIF